MSSGLTPYTHPGNRLYFRLDDRHQSTLCREWAVEVKQWAKAPGGSGGWIYTKLGTGETVTQGWGSIWYWHEAAILDWLTAKLTGFDTFTAMVEAQGSYRPTILPRNWRYEALANAYDAAQERRRDPRRAFRGSRTMAVVA